MGKLDGKVALITGGGSGIGKALALLFAEEGAKVVIADNIAEGAEEAVRIITTTGGDAAFVRVDVSKATDVQKMVKTTIDTYGQLDILCNNAGVETEWVLIEEHSEDGWDRIIDINLKGVFLGMKYGIPEMLNKGGGVIINTASIDGVVGLPKHAAYCASKAGVIVLTKVAALEYGSRNVRVNCICPGIIDTPLLEREIHAMGETMATHQWRQLGPLGRLGKPEEIAKVALFLASDESSFVSGAALMADAGYLAGSA